MFNSFSDSGYSLKKVTASTGNVIEDPETGTIPNNGYSETFSGSNCVDWALLIIFGAPATGSVIIEEVIDAGASTNGETFDTLVVTAERIGRWSAGELLPGFFRVKNTSGQDATITFTPRIH